MAGIAALLVGIGAYARTPMGAMPALKYPPADADGIAGYIEACWPKPEDRIVMRIAEEAATLTAVEAGFAALANGGRHDLLIVFLSGHGIVEPNRRGYLLQPAGVGGANDLLDPATLDRLLASVEAERTILILDCCFAEAVAGALAYFSQLGGDRARLFIASSRANQLTWEEDAAGHGVFTVHLLDLLNTGSSASLSGVRDTLDVDGELFPVLCEQVPLYVFEHKNAEQDPVKGGIAAGPVTLPVARAARRIRERTPLATAFRRIRQITLGLSAACIAFLIFAYSMLYYVVPDPSGTLVVRHGTRWLDPIFRYLSPVRVDTGIPAAALSSDPIASYPLLVGYTTGIWTHRTITDGDGNGYRSWYATVAAGLAPHEARRFDLFVGANDAPVALDDESLPSDVLTATWAALARDKRTNLPAILTHLPASGRLLKPLLSHFPANMRDFSILDQSAEAMQTYADAVCRAAALDPVRTFPAWVGFAKATQEWLAHNSDEQRGRGARALVRGAVADCLGVLARARRDRGLAPLDPAALTLLETLAGLGYGDIINASLSRVPGRPNAGQEYTRVLAAFDGNPEDPAQAAAMEAAILSLDGSARSKLLVDDLVARFERAGNGQSGYVARLLIEAADTKSLSPERVMLLVAAARHALAKPERDFEDSELSRILAHALSSVPAADRSIIYRLIALTTADLTPMASTTAEIYATLARQRLDTPAMFAHVERQARLAKPYTLADPATARETLPGMTIAVGAGPWIAALAQFAESRPLPPQDIAALRGQLINPVLRQIVIRALAAQENSADARNPVPGWLGQLAACVRNASDRAIRQTVITQHLAAMPRPQFEATIASLRKARAATIEPELRIALGAVLADAPYWRVRPAERGLGLFE